MLQKLDKKCYNVHTLSRYIKFREENIDMKKIYAIILTFLLVGTFTACGTETDAQANELAEPITEELNLDKEILSLEDIDSTAMPTLEKYIESKSEIESTDISLSEENQMEKSSDANNAVSSKTVESSTTTEPTDSAKDTTTPAPTVTPTQKPASTPKSSDICPICNSKLEADGRCYTVHNYTGYAYQIYDETTDCVYVVCNTCGQKWKRNSFSNPWEFSNQHGISCYHKANQTVFEFEDGCEGKHTFKGNCEKAPKPTATPVPTCNVCGSTEHASHPVCRDTGHTIDGTCSVCGSTYIAPKCSEIGHSADGTCNVCGNSYTTPVSTPELARCDICGSTDHIIHPPLDNDQLIEHTPDKGYNEASDGNAVFEE